MSFFEVQIYFYEWDFFLDVKYILHLLKVRQDYQISLQSIYSHRHLFISMHLCKFLKFIVWLRFLADEKGQNQHINFCVNICSIHRIFNSGSLALFYLSFFLLNNREIVSYWLFWLFRVGVLCRTLYWFFFVY